MVDKQSGKDFNREGYLSLKNTLLRSGDVLVVKELDRLGRNKQMIMEELSYFKEAGVRVKILNIPTTLLDCDGQEDVVLEHFGMMDNNSYCENAIRKINGYQRNGYYPGKNFLYTFETYKNPVDIKNFEIMIRNRFHL